MSLTKEGYIIRLIDDKVAKYLRVFGAVSIEGPKWCGNSNFRKALDKIRRSKKWETLA